jgi:hypothetical protein
LGFPRRPIATCARLGRLLVTMPDSISQTTDLPLTLATRPDLQVLQPNGYNKTVTVVIIAQHCTVLVTTNVAIGGQSNSSRVTIEGEHSGFGGAKTR